MPVMLITYTPEDVSMLVGLGFLAGLLAGYAFVSLAESVLHDHIGHARIAFRRLQTRYSTLLGVFAESYRSHSIVHHRWTYRDHICQFASSQHRRNVDARLRDDGGRRIIEDRYGATLTLRSAILFVAPILPVVAPLFFLLPGPAAAGLLLPVTIYPLMSMVIHPYLHMRHDEALARANLLLRALFATNYMKAVWCHHWLHHKYPSCNFNLLLGGDWVRGVHHYPDSNDIAEMSAAGMPIR